MFTVLVMSPWKDRFHSFPRPYTFKYTLLITLNRSNWWTRSTWPIWSNTWVLNFITSLWWLQRLWLHRLGSGPPGLPGEDGVCTQECAPQQQVSFFAGLSTNCNARGEAIPFDTVMTNQCQGCEGEAAQGAYDGETGSFTAPVDGTYVFHVNVLLRI